MEVYDDFEIQEFQRYLNNEDEDQLSLEDEEEADQDPDDGISPSQEQNRSVNNMNPSYLNSTTFIPNELHTIFPIKNPWITFITRFRQKVQREISRSSSSVSLLLCVNKHIIDASPNDRLLHILQCKKPTLVPIFIYQGDASRILSFIKEVKNKNRVYNNYDLHVTALSTGEVSPKLSDNRHKFAKWVVKLLFASCQNPEGLRHLRFTVLNSKHPDYFWKRYANCVNVGDLVNTVRDILQSNKYILCVNSNCENEECKAFFHVGNFRLLASSTDNDTQSVPVNVLDPSVSINLYSEHSFGIRIIRPTVLFGNDDVLSTDEILNSFQNDLEACRTLASIGYTYVVGGMHVPINSTPPEQLSLEIINDQNRLFIYVGQSMHRGMGRHHLNDFSSTDFAKCIKEYGLNCFWFIRNDTYSNSVESEKWEALLQLMVRRIVYDGLNEYIFSCNKRLEISQLDFCSDEELLMMTTTLSNPDINFLCNVKDNAVDYGIYKTPLELNKAVAFCVQ